MSNLKTVDEIIDYLKNTIINLQNFNKILQNVGMNNIIHAYEQLLEKIDKNTSNEKYKFDNERVLFNFECKEYKLNKEIVKFNFELEPSFAGGNWNKNDVENNQLFINCLGYLCQKYDDDSYFSIANSNGYPLCTSYTFYDEESIRKIFPKLLKVEF